MKLRLVIAVIFLSRFAEAQSSLDEAWTSRSATASPWTIWYWMHGAVTKEALSADIKAMSEAGLGGALLMPIKAPLQPPHIPNAVLQLTPGWWEMVRHSFSEAKRYNISLGIHVSDGFALAGGPWIKPEQSMQKLTWSVQQVKGSQNFNGELERPPTAEGYYRDVAVFAYPTPRDARFSTNTTRPRITGSKTDSSLFLLADPSNKKTFGSDTACFIQYAFDAPFTARTVVIRSRNNYEANRLVIQSSNDGVVFKTIKQLQPPRHGWQDWDENYTHSIPATTARYFRFVFDKRGTEPGAEDLDAAKWKPSLRLTGIELSGEARIESYEGKNGSVWRIAEPADPKNLRPSDCIPLSKLVNLTPFLKNGRLQWKVPAGEWTIIRMGHTSTGHRNETAGGGKGLECDKFDEAAIRLQFDNWFGAFYREIDSSLVHHVLKYLHIDSWECGSQNWSTSFADEFKKRRGYSLVDYLPVMAGIPLVSPSQSEKVLRDVRETIAELVNDKFYKTLKAVAVEKGVEMTAESVAPTMVSDGLLHYQTADIPMGEFWLRSPTHDKPNDMLDAISGAHVYGKNMVAAESFTELRMAWDEHPGMVKPLLDRNFALGINRVFYHVYVTNPWLDRKPGMSLDAIGFFFQRDQTWWSQVAAFVDYTRRCQSLLQMGSPVTDIAVYTGEEIPRRSVLPHRLAPVLPGLIGKERVAREKIRLENKGQPLRQLPAGVTHSANMALPEDWTDPLHGYAYDSYNPDALLRLSTVKNGRLQLSTGASYGILVLPGANRMSPVRGLLSEKSVTKIRRLVSEGLTVVAAPDVLQKLRNSTETKGQKGALSIGKGRLVTAPLMDNDLERFGIAPDLLATERGARAEAISWTHRAGAGFDIYFISNGLDTMRNIRFSVRQSGTVPEIWDPVDGSKKDAIQYTQKAGRTEVSVMFDRYASKFIVFRKKGVANANGVSPAYKQQLISGAWTLRFDSSLGGPSIPVIWDSLQSWSTSADTAIRYYSGTVSYKKKFRFDANTSEASIDLGAIANLATVIVNGKECGIAWTPPYRVDISNAIRQGENELEIRVTNTWANRMIGDQQSQSGRKVTFTSYPFKMQGRPLLPAGLFGPVQLFYR